MPVATVLSVCSISFLDVELNTMTQSQLRRKFSDTNFPNSCSIFYITMHYTTGTKVNADWVLCQSV